MVITAVVNKADPRTTNGVVYPPTCVKKKNYSKLLIVRTMFRLIHLILKASFTAWKNIFISRLFALKIVKLCWD